MWLALAFMSAALLGCYDSFKKKALGGNAVVPVLFLNTLFSSLVFLPFICLSAGTTVLDGTAFHVGGGGWRMHGYILAKSVLVLSSWFFGYMGMKRLPLTIVGPINATRPVMVLIGAFIVFGERLNACQWMGVALAVASFFMLSRSGRKEGIDFRRDRWIYSIVLAAFLGAASGLYDRYLMAPVESGGVGLDHMAVQCWYNIYQCGIMGVALAALRLSGRGPGEPFRWDWAILGISLFLCAADFVYFYALSFPEAMVSVVSMVRRGSVVVSFLFGAAVFHERNLGSKAVDLLLVLLGLLLLYMGSR